MPWRVKSASVSSQGARYCSPGKKNECLGRYERYLRKLGVLADDLEAEIKEEAVEALRKGIAEAEAEPDADVSLLFDHAYVDPPPHLRDGWLD